MSKFLPLMPYTNVLNFHVYKTVRSGYPSCLMKWGSATPSPDPAVSPIHSFIFLYSPSSSPPLSRWQTGYYFRDSQICSNTWNQPRCLFKIQNLQEVGHRNLFFKIFTVNSYDQSGLLIPIPDYYGKPDAFKRHRGRHSLYACNIIVYWRKIN